MAIAESYRKQVALLIRAVPFVAHEKEFALKAVRWKLENLAKLPHDKRAQLLKGLNEAIGTKVAAR